MPLKTANTVASILVWMLATSFVNAAPEASPSPPTTCERNVVLTGYWPPTNEMLRQFSTNPSQNPDGWQGENWHDHGFNIYAYFPEFPPDGAPFNDPRGSDGWVGSPDSDLRVDYQDTSADFWRITEQHRPLILITTSRGIGAGWEVEAIEGGHTNSTEQPELDWSSDYRAPLLHPSESGVDPRSWAAISLYRNDKQLSSTLPMQAIVQAAAALGITDVGIDDQTSGNYLSGFIALHGLYYNHISPQNIAAGHIHVNDTKVDTTQAKLLMETTLTAVLSKYNADLLECSHGLNP